MKSIFLMSDCSNTWRSREGWPSMYFPIQLIYNSFIYQNPLLFHYKFNACHAPFCHAQRDFLEVSLWICFFLLANEILKGWKTGARNLRISVNWFSVFIISGLSVQTWHCKTEVKLESRQRDSGFCDQRVSEFAKQEWKVLRHKISRNVLTYGFKDWIVFY